LHNASGVPVPQGVQGATRLGRPLLAVEQHARTQCARRPGTDAAAPGPWTTNACVLPRRLEALHEELALLLIFCHARAAPGGVASDRTDTGATDACVVVGGADIHRSAWEATRLPNAEEVPADLPRRSALAARAAAAVIAARPDAAVGHAQRGGGRRCGRRR